MGKKKKRTHKQVMSHLSSYGKGAPNKYQMYLPPISSQKLKYHGGIDNEDIIWDMDWLMEFIFPKDYAPVSHKLATKFMRFVLLNEEVGTWERAKFKSENGINPKTRGTLENKVIPKLVRFGLLKQRRTIRSSRVALKASRRPMVHTDSMAFATYIERIAKAWRLQVATHRMERDRINRPGIKFRDKDF